MGVYMDRKPLGELLVEASVINQEQLNYALTLQKQKFTNKKLGQIIMSLNHVDPDTLLEFLGKQYSSPTINLQRETIEEEALYIIPKDIAKRYKVLAVGFEPAERAKKLVVAMTDPSNLALIDFLTFITGYKVKPILARKEELSWIITYYYNKKELFTIDGFREMVSPK
jgi:type IV pilus assembly protein PilB